MAGDLQWLGGIEAILFDLDGTLIETDNRWAEVLAGRLEPLERLWPRLNAAALARRLVMASETPMNYCMSLLEHLGIGSGFFGLADAVRRSRGVATRDSAVAVDGSAALLEALAPRFRLALVTTRARREAVGMTRMAGLEQYFAVVITRQDVLRMKPHPEPILKAAARLGVAPGRCLMVGDTTVDMRAARRAGAAAAGVLSGFGMREELEEAGAQLILDSAILLLGELSRAGLAVGKRD